MMSEKSPSAQDHSLMVEVDGEGVGPKTVDAEVFLEIAASFFALIRANAMEDGVSLDFTGVEILDKCVAVATTTKDPLLTKNFVTRSLLQIAGGESLHRNRVGRVRKALHQLQKGLKARVLVGGDWKRTIVHESRIAHVPSEELIIIRAVPMRVGGKNPTVRFSSDFEDEFSISCDKELSQGIGTILYKEAEIEALIKRNAKGAIKSGKLLSFIPISDDDPTLVWRDWFRSVGGGEWDAIVDYRAELDR
jgi:hypothetical protein